MATKKKLLQAAAGSAGGDALDIPDVFSTYMYEGTAATLAIDNGIDLSGEGGLVWLKSRDNAGGTSNNVLLDTERGANTSTAHLQSDTTGAAATGYLNSFNSNGFTLASNGGRKYNYSGSDYASWTFLKSKRFFDIQTWTGDGTKGRQIAHNLDGEPGMIVIKATSASDWFVWHRSLPNRIIGTPNRPYTLKLNTTASQSGDDSIGPCTAQNIVTGEDASKVNTSGTTYVAYVFAHNDNGDGEFGPDSDQDIIKCGSFVTTTGTVDVDLGFEPQFVLMKSSTTTDNWTLVDTMRGWTNNRYGTNKLSANTSGAEEGSVDFVTLTSTGFKAVYPTSSLATNQTYIYMAIRRGPLAVPESATDVFAIDTAENQDPRYTSGFPVDFALNKLADLTTDWTAASRLNQGKILRTNTTAAEGSSASMMFDYNTGWFVQNSADPDNYSWMWKRAPGYFDVVTYLGNSTAGRTVSHNLGVAPEIMWVKKRNSSSNSNWKVYHVANGNNYHMFLNLTSKGATSAGSWNNTTPTDSVFTLGNAQDVNNSGDSYIAYLFASLDGVSKCGGYTGNGAGEYVTGGSSQTIDCGFTSGARFVLIKSTSIASNDWQLWDSVRGIVAGNDPHLSLNTTAAEVTSDDSVDAHSSGFTVNQVAATNVNASGETYIFYAIA